MLLWSGVLLFGAELNACRSRANVEQATPQPQRRVSDAGTTPRDASTRDTSADAAPTPQRVPVDLLSTMGLSLAVSSSVNNVGDRPEHLVDHNAATAWNSATGDLEGAWIDVRVPAGVTVTGLRMIVGYAAINRRNQDLFVMNHRVRRIEVLRDGQSLGQFSLDIEQRTLQTVAFSGGAGTYRIRLVELVPGSRRDWREACVSEFELLGHAPANADAGTPSTPIVSVGALPPDEPAVPTARASTLASIVTGPTASTRAFCAEQMRTRDRAACAEEDPEGGSQDVCFCGIASDAIEAVPSGQARLERPAGAVLGASILPVFTDPSRGVQCALLMQTQAGWYAVHELANCMREPNMTGNLRRMVVRRFEAQVQGTATTLTVSWDAISSDLQEGETSGPICGESAELQCTVPASGAPTCTRTVRVPHDCSRRWRSLLTES